MNACATDDGKAPLVIPHHLTSVTLVPEVAGSRCYAVKVRRREVVPFTGCLISDNRGSDWRMALRPDGLSTPLSRRLGPQHPRFEEIMRLHAEAVRRGKPSYRDPVSGYTVFTAAFLAGRDYCCASGCRHCPYDDLH